MVLHHVLPVANTSPTTTSQSTLYTSSRERIGLLIFIHSDESKFSVIILEKIARGRARLCEVDNNNTTYCRQHNNTVISTVVILLLQ